MQAQKMLIKRNQIGDLVVATLVLSSCYIPACAVGVDNTVDASADESGRSSAGGGASGASNGGSVGSTGRAGMSSTGATGGGGRSGGGKGGGSATGGRGSGGATGSAGRGGSGRGGGSATGTGGRGTGATTGMGGRGGSAATGGRSGGGVGKGGGSATGGTTGAVGTVVKIDLSTFQPTAAGSYNGISRTLAIVAEPFFQFPLPRAFTTGQSVAVHVTGTNSGTAGLRSWLVDNAQTTLSNIVTTYVGAGLPSGSFTLDYTLTATNSAGFLFYKGPNVGVNIDNVTISAITITY
jgi:hypothetical protein